MKQVREVSQVLDEVVMGLLRLYLAVELFVRLVRK